MLYPAKKQRERLGDSDINNKSKNTKSAMFVHLSLEEGKKVN